MIKRKIVEYFKIIKKGKEKLIKKEGFEKVEEKSSKKQIKEENKILRNIFIILGVLILVLVGIYLALYNTNNFEYKGVKFDVLKEGDIVFYHTSFPAILNGDKVNYNVYIRNDPRKLEKEIPFVGSMNLPELFVINNTESFSCEGDGGISMYNLQQVLRALGISFITDPDASCDIAGRYGFLLIQPGNLSGVGQFIGPSCYLLQVNNCEILKVTERFLVEALVKEIGEKWGAPRFPCEDT